MKDYTNVGATFSRLNPEKPCLEKPKKRKEKKRKRKRKRKNKRKEEGTRTCI